MRIRSANEFGAVARQRRRDLGLSQHELSRRAGVTRQWLVRFEAGNSEVSVSKMFAVLTELGLIVRTEAPESVASAKFSIPTVDPSAVTMETLQRSIDLVRDPALQRRLERARDLMADTTEGSVGDG